jgi:ABC-type nitrate/sulfonate/bicarbonate transport system substrate-binding protein
MSFSAKRDNMRVLDHHYAVVEPRTVVGSYLTTEQWLNANQDFARRFVAALTRATDFIRNDQQTTRQILVKYTQVDAATTAAMQLTEFEEQHRSEDIQRWIDEMLRWKMISAPVEASAVFRTF